MFPPVLKLDLAGLPVSWVSWQTAVVLYARKRICWEAGESSFVVHGGFSPRTGVQSALTVGSIIAVADRANRKGPRVPTLNNRSLFQRDQNLCLYCGKEFGPAGLTCDHVFPLSRGGASSWENCVSACAHCNQQKAARTPEEAGMKLLAVPYAPNFAEYLILQNRRILADQMAFLKTFARRVPQTPRRSF